MTQSSTGSMSSGELLRTLPTAFDTTWSSKVSASAGAVAETAGWFWFFGVSALVGIPALALLAWLQARGHFDPIETEAELAAVRPAGAP